MGMARKTNQMDRSDQTYHCFDVELNLAQVYKQQHDDVQEID